MRRIILIILSLFFILATQCARQMYRDYWVIPEEISDYGVWDIAVDGTSNVYIIGSIEDYVVVKYDASGNELWSRMYNGPADSSDFASAMALDDLGNVYVTGCSLGALHRQGSHETPTFDYATVKYDKDGNQLWVAMYDSFEDLAADMAVDHAGNVYVTGVSDSSSHAGMDYVTIKYDTNGNELWVASYEETVINENTPPAIAVDDYGNAYVTGGAATIKYDSSGSQLWAVMSGPQWGATEIAVDRAGNAYVTGYSDQLVTKYGKDGNELWKSTYRGSIGSAHIALDSLKNIYITGTTYSKSTNSDFITIKYNNLGQEEWIAKYGGVFGSKDEASAIAVDNKGNVYVTGSETHGLRMARFFNWPGKISPWVDFITLKYNAGGKKQWTARISGKASESNWGKAITVDDVGNVYVTGNGYHYVDWRTAGTVPSSWFTTIKYNANGEQQYLTRF